MQYIHEHLRKTFAWYDKWHTDVHSSAVSWGVFLLVALFFTFASLDAIEKQARNASVIEAIPIFTQKDSAPKIVPPPEYQYQTMPENFETSSTN